MNFKEIWALIRKTFQEWREDKASRLAAALSYYTVFSLAPLLVIVLAITSFIVGSNQAMRQQIIAQVQSTMGPQGAKIANTLIDNMSRPSSGGVAAIVSVIVLILGSTTAFAQLQDALNTIWEVKPKGGKGIKGVMKDRFLSFAMVLGLAFLLLVSLVISTSLSAVSGFIVGLFGGSNFVAQVVNFVITVFVATFIFAAIFKVLPDVTIGWEDVWIGAAVTALLFTIGQILLGFYLGKSAAISAYGAAGSLIAVLLWIYYSAQILFLGAEFTQVYARRQGSRIMPTENAVRITDDERVKADARPHQSQLENVRQSMMPVTGEPDVYAEPAVEPERVKVRYQPPDPDSVLPLIAGGVLAAAVTVGKIVGQVVSTVQERRWRNRRYH